jgi:hypothetical protein
MPSGNNLPEGEMETSPLLSLVAFSDQDIGLGRMVLPVGDAERGRFSLSPVSRRKLPKCVPFACQANFGR